MYPEAKMVPGMFRCLPHLLFFYLLLEVPAFLHKHASQYPLLFSNDATALASPPRALLHRATFHSSTHGTTTITKRASSL